MGAFKCGFDINDYWDILPPIPNEESIKAYQNGQYLLMPDPPIELMNGHIDDLDDQYWIKQPVPEIITPEFIFREVTRLKKGVWIFINGELIWIPPNYYQFLQYGNANGDDIQFRLKELMAVYEKIRVRRDLRYLGIYRIKNRQDGATTISMNDLLWEVGSGELNNGMGGIQSKTNEDAENPCWYTLMSLWNGYPQFLKDAIYPHFASGDSILTKMFFLKKADPNNPNEKAQQALLKYFPSVHNAMDGKSAVRRCVLDEINKWKVCSFKKTFNNYLNFIKLGKSRRGVFDILSSPADTDGEHNREAYDFWCGADPKKITELGATPNRIKRIYSCPLQGREGYYDKFGDCDPEEIYEDIIKERRTTPKDDLMAFIRAHPLPKKGTFEPDEDELFGATDGGTSVFFNIEGLKRQSLFLEEMPAGVMYGNLQWPDSIPFSGWPIFAPYDTDKFDEVKARFCFSFLKFIRPETGDIKKLPLLIENCIGFDPINRELGSANKKVKKRLSQPAAVCYRFKDVAGYGIEKEVIGSYLGPSGDQRASQMDMLKFMLFTQSKMQLEKADGNSMMKCAYENGMLHWLLDGRQDDFVELIDPSDATLKKVRVKGDMPSGRGASEFMLEIIDLINGATSSVYQEDSSDPAEKMKHKEVVDSLISFDPLDTEKAHLAMAFGQSLLGSAKILYGKKARKLGVNNNMINEVLMH